MKATLKRLVREHGRRREQARDLTRDALAAGVQHQGRWKHGDMVARYTRGEAAGEALKWL